MKITWQGIAMGITTMLVFVGVYTFLYGDKPPTETCEARWTDTNGNTHCEHQIDSLWTVGQDSGRIIIIREGVDLSATHTQWLCMTDTDTLGNATSFYLSIIRPVAREYKEAK